MTTHVTTQTAVLTTVTDIHDATQAEETVLIHLANTTTNNVTVEVWRGASGGSAAGTELFPGVLLTPKGTPGCVFPWPFKVKLSSVQFLTARSSAVGVTATVTTNQVAS